MKLKINMIHVNIIYKEEIYTGGEWFGRGKREEC